MEIAKRKRTFVRRCRPSVWATLGLVCIFVLCGCSNKVVLPHVPDAVSEVPYAVFAPEISVDCLDTDGTLLAQCTLKKVETFQQYKGEDLQETGKVVYTFGLDQINPAFFGEDVIHMCINCEVTAYDKEKNAVAVIHATLNVAKDTANGAEINIVRNMQKFEPIDSFSVQVTGVDTEYYIPEPLVGEKFFAFFNQRRDITDFAEGFYDSMPVSATVYVDRGGDGETAVTEDPDAIADVFACLQDTVVEKKTDMSITDAYHFVSFSMEDGREIFFSFEGEWFSYMGSNYVLDNPKLVRELYRLAGGE